MNSLWCNFHIFFHYWLSVWVLAKIALPGSKIVNKQTQEKCIRNSSNRLDNFWVTLKTPKNWRVIEREALLSGNMKILKCFLHMSHFIHHWMRRNIWFSRNLKNNFDKFNIRCWWSHCWDFCARTSSRMQDVMVLFKPNNGKTR